MLISQSAAANELGITKQALHQKVKEHIKKTGKNFSFMEKNERGVWKVNNENPDWLVIKASYEAKSVAAEMKGKKKSYEKGWEADLIAAQSKLNKKKSRKILKMKLTNLVSIGNLLRFRSCTERPVLPVLRKEYLKQR